MRFKFYVIEWNKYIHSIFVIPVMQFVIFTRIICPWTVTMSLSDDAMASLSVFEGDVGIIKRVAFSILSSGTSKAVALMILECPDKTTLFAFTRKFLSWRVLPSLILLNWLSSLSVAIITLVKSAMLKFSMLPGTPLLPVNLAVWPTFATLTVNFPFG